MSENPVYTPNNEFYRKDVQGFLPEMMQQIYNDRVKYKKKMIATKKKLQKEKDGDKRVELYKLISIISFWNRTFIKIILISFEKLVAL